MQVKIKNMSQYLKLPISGEQITLKMMHKNILLIIKKLIYEMH